MSGMRGWSTIAAKEILENLRDRRTVFVAFVYGPILLPLILLGQTVLMSRTATIDPDRTQSVSILGSDRAPNLLAALGEANLLAAPAPGDWVAALGAGTIDAVLEIPETYVINSAAGQPAPLLLHFDAGRQPSQKLAQQVRQVLWQKNAELRQLRLLAHGLDPMLGLPIAIIDRDISAEGPGGMLLGFSLYFMMMLTMTMAGFYIAVDNTAGERERHSLEPLLALPLDRSAVALGKYTAILTFMLVATAVFTAVLGLGIALLPFEELSMFNHMTVGPLVAVWLIATPLAPLLAAVELWVASRARSVKEAQISLMIPIVIPVLPLALATLLPAESSASKLVPFLTHFRMIAKLAGGVTPPAGAAVLGALAAICVGLAILFAATRSFRRERLLQG